MHGQDKDLRERRSMRGVADDLQRVQPGHLEINNQDARVQPLHEIQVLISSGSLADD
jgi:hypothetical protein